MNLDRFQELKHRFISETVPGWRWCLHPKCEAGQVHDPQPANQRSPNGTLPAPTPDLCICNVCGTKACVPCDRLDHRPETCSEYQERIKDRADEARLSEAALLDISKPCPGCKKPIEKDGGCRNMVCHYGCTTHFCWDCVEILNDAGRCSCTSW